MDKIDIDTVDLKSTPSKMKDSLDDYEMAKPGDSTSDSVKRKRVRRRKKKAGPDGDTSEPNTPKSRIVSKESIERSFMEPPSKRTRNCHVRWVDIRIAKGDIYA